jgi:hypothetical protein
MAENLKELIFNKLAEVLKEKGTENGLTIESGYDCLWYQDGTPTAVVTDTSSIFNYEVVNTIPFSEVLSDETPSVNSSDRSEFNLQYMITFQLEVIDKVKLTLQSYRDYFFENRHQVLGDYNVVFKVVRGNKIRSWEAQSGELMGAYQLGVYCTASKGYLNKPTDKWEIRNVTQSGTFVDLPLLSESCSYQANTNPSLAEPNTTFTVKSYVLNKKFTIYYDESTFAKEVYDLAVYGGVSETYEIKETFDGITGTAQKVLIVGATRTIQPNAPLILDFDLLKVTE